jgi:hypothetical protein
MIPNFVPSHLKDQWSTVYTSALPRGDAFATVFANQWVLQNALVQEPVKRSAETLSRLSFTIQEEQLIARTEDGEDYMTAVLSDNQPYIVPSSDGKITVERFSDSVLQKFADIINKEQLVGDTDHEFYDSCLNQNLSNEQIKRALKQKPGIAKAVRAVIDKGRLFLRLLIDKRYRKVLEKAKGLSLEALVSKDQNGTVLDGDLLGFTFAIDQTPVNQRAVMVA